MQRESDTTGRNTKKVVYTCEATGIKVEKIINTLTDMNFIYIIPTSGKKYAVTEECADDLIKSFK